MMDIDEKYEKSVEFGYAWQDMLAHLAGDQDAQLIAARAFKVNTMYREVIGRAYRKNAQHMLDHTNSVYIADKDGQKHLIVYVDESIYAADLNAQRELIKLLFLKNHDEAIDAFDIYVSRRGYKDKYPFRLKEEKTAQKPRPLTRKDREYVDSATASIEDPALRREIMKAMIACLQWDNEEED